MCQKVGLGIISWSPLGGGILTGKYKSGKRPKEGTRLAAPGPLQIYRRRALSERNLAIVSLVVEEAKRLNVTPIALTGR